MWFVFYGFVVCLMFVGFGLGFLVLGFDDWCFGSLRFAGFDFGDFPVTLVFLLVWMFWVWVLGVAFCGTGAIRVYGLRILCGFAYILGFDVCIYEFCVFL